MCPLLLHRAKSWPTIKGSDWPIDNDLLITSRVKEVAQTKRSRGSLQTASNIEGLLHLSWPEYFNCDVFVFSRRH